MARESSQKPPAKAGLRSQATVVRERGRLLAALGQDRPRQLPRPILLRFMGGGDEESWVEFFRSLPGRPSYIVSDRDAAIANAIVRAWPDAPPVQYLSHHHPKANAMNAAKKDGWDPHDPLFARFEQMLIEPEDQFVPLRDEAHQRRAKALVGWLDDNRALIEGLVELRKSFPGNPLSAGAAESTLREVKCRLGFRVHVMSNAARLDRLLALMVFDLGKLADEVLYAGIIRRRFEANSGRAGAAWATRRDAAGTSSIATLIASAETRQTQMRASRIAAGKSRNYRRKRVEYEKERAAAGLPPAPTAGRPRILTARSDPRMSRLARATRSGGSATAAPTTSGRSRYAARHALPLLHPPAGGAVRIARGRLLPDVAAQWHPTRNAKTPVDYTHASHIEAWWQCLEFRTHVWRARIASRTVMLTGCSACASKGGRPKPGRSQKTSNLVQLKETHASELPVRMRGRAISRPWCTGTEPSNGPSSRRTERPPTARRSPGRADRVAIEGQRGAVRHRQVGLVAAEAIARDDGRRSDATDLDARRIPLDGVAIDGRGRADVDDDRRADAAADGVAADLWRCAARDVDPVWLSVTSLSATTTAPDHRFRWPSLVCVASGPPSRMRFPRMTGSSPA